MEVIGFAASLTNLIQATEYVLRILRDVKSGGQDRKRLLAELIHLESVLLRLQTGTAEASSKIEAWLDTVDSLKSTGGVFEQIDDVIQEMRVKVERKQGFRGVLQSFSWPFVKEDIDRNARQMQRLSQLVSITLQEASLRLSLTMTKGVSRLSLTTNKRELRAILEWMSPLNFLEQQKLEFDKHSPGTCAWFLNAEDFLSWKSRKEQVLYCSAIGGAGKTVLASVAVDNLRMSNAGNNVGIFMFYCKHDRSDTHSVFKLAMTLLKQLVQIKLGVIPPDLEKLLEEHYYTNDTKPELKQVLDVIDVHLPSFSQIFIIVDGLDEIPDDTTRQKIVAFFLQLSGSLSVMFTSRPLDAIECLFVPVNTSYSILHEPEWPEYVSDDDTSENFDYENNSDESEDGFQAVNDEKALISFGRQGLQTTVNQQPVDGINPTGSPSNVPEGVRDNDRTAAVDCSHCHCVLKNPLYQCRQCENPKFILCAGCVEKNISCNFSEHEVVFRRECLKMDVSAKPRAIRRYVRRRIAESPELIKWVQRKTWFAEEIEEVVTSSAQKMFLLAQLHMDAISDPNLLKFSEVRGALQALPQRLNDSYDKAMERVQGHGLSLLELVAFAERPLTTQEAEHALGVTLGFDKLPDEEIIPATTLVSRCAGLVMIDANGAISFSHYTIVGYFGGRRTELFPNGHIQMAQICFTYLNLAAFNEGPAMGPEEAIAYDSRLSQFPFLDYAACFWGFHIRESGDENTESLAFRFLSEKHKRDASIQALWFSTDKGAANWRVRNGATALHLAVFFKLRKFVIRLIQEGADVTLIDPLGISTLMWAAETGDAELVESILSAGASINARAPDGRTALHTAVPNRHKNVCAVLIKQPNLDVNAQYGKRKSSTLMLAVQEEMIDTVQQLAERKDLLLNARDSRGLTALHFAAYNPGSDFVKILLRVPSINVDELDFTGDTALLVAARKGRLDNVKYLLDANADPNIVQSQTESCGTILMRAIDYDRQHVVRELLSRNADWKAQDTMGRGMLHSAAINDSVHSLKILVDLPGIDVNAQDVYGNTPMHDAASLKHSTALLLLLKHGARIDIPNNRGKTPLEIARENGASSNLKILKERYAENVGMPKGSMTDAPMGEVSILAVVRADDEVAVDALISDARSDPSIDLDERDEWLQRTAMQHAVHLGNFGIVKKLLAAGVDIDTQDKYGRSALQIAAMIGWVSVARHLLSKKANTETRDRWNESPIRSAQSAGNWRTTICLIEYGADLSEIDELETLLLVAAESGSTKACQRLIEAGADVQIKDASGRSPYEIAKRAGYLETAKYLDRSGMLASSPLPSPDRSTPLSSTTSIPALELGGTSHSEISISSPGVASQSAASNERISCSDSQHLRSMFTHWLLKLSILVLMALVLSLWLSLSRKFSMKAIILIIATSALPAVFNVIIRRRTSPLTQFRENSELSLGSPRKAGMFVLGAGETTPVVSNELRRKIARTSVLQRTVY